MIITIRSHITLYIILKSSQEQVLTVFRNDEISLEEVGGYEKILLSPGPGVPSDAGICIDLIKYYASTKSILGICLGHQAIGEAFGGKILNLSNVYHGVSTPVSYYRYE